MFAKLHLLSQDTPEGGAGLRWRPHPYLRLAGAVLKGPAVFDWSARQREDLEALWRDPAADGARERLAADLAAFADKLGWAPEAEVLEDAEKRGDEYLMTLSAVPPELYVLPWEVIQVGAAGTYLSDYASAQVRYAVPGLEPREIQAVPPKPGVLFAWSGAGGAVPHEEQAAAIRAAAEAGGVTFHELAEVDERSLQAALDAGPPSALHLLCHGLPGPEGEPPRLRWGASDNPSEITATQLARMLRSHHDSIRLVVLSACGSGDGHRDPLFMSSLAQELHKKGIPSVVASRYPLSVCGSCVMTRALYDKMLREAWSLERALRHTRQALLHVADHGEMHPGDGYGIQLYAYDTERFVSDNDVLAERPVLASYPFGTPARPVPTSGPPAAELTLGMDADSSLSEDDLVDQLRRMSEDKTLTVAIPLRAGGGECSLIVRTTVDGAQRLLGAWRSKVLQVAIGVTAGELFISKAVMPALKGMFASAAGKAGTAGGKAAARAKSATAAGKAGTVAGQAGSAAGQAGTAAGQAGTAAGQAGTAAGQAGTAAGQAGTAAGQAGTAAGQAGTATGQAVSLTAGKTAVTAAALTGKAITAKVAVVALLSSVAAVGGAAAYRAQTQPSPRAPETLASNAPGYEPGSPPRSAPWPPPVAPEPPPRSAPEPSPKAIEPAPTKPSEPSPKAIEPPPTRSPEPPPKPVEPLPSKAPQPPPKAVEPPPIKAPQPPPKAAEPPPIKAPQPPPTIAAPQPRPTAEAAPPNTPEPPAGGRAGSAGVGAGSNSDRAGTATRGAGSVANSDCSGDPEHPGSGDPSAGCAGNRSPAPPAEAVCGNRIVEPGEQCDDGNTRNGDGCSSTCVKEVVARSPVTIEPRALHDLQVSGDTNVLASKLTRDSMIRNHVNSLRAVVKLCVDTTGLVTDSTMVERSGYTEYDSKLVEVVREWRYRPYLINSTPAPVCSTVEFIYLPQ
jgi:TonB family protein